eukprot:1183425-Prorocentrum_minimum.AAC.1
MRKANPKYSRPPLFTPLSASLKHPLHIDKNPRSIRLPSRRLHSAEPPPDPLFGPPCQALLDATVLAESLHRHFSYQDWAPMGGLPQERANYPGGSEGGVEGGALAAHQRVARALRAYERETVARTSSKVRKKKRCAFKVLTFARTCM